MSDRSSNIMSTSGVALAIVGTALHDVVLSVLGPAIALAVHCWTEWRMAKRKRDEASLLERLKYRNYELEMELAKLRGSTPQPPSAKP